MRASFPVRPTIGQDIERGHNGASSSRRILRYFPGNGDVDFVVLDGAGDLPIVERSAPAGGTPRVGEGRADPSKVDGGSLVADRAVDRLRSR